MKTATSCTLPPIVASEQPKSVSRAHASDGGTRPRAVVTHSLLESSPGPPSRLAPLSTRQGRLDTLMTSLETLSCVAGESTARKLKLATEANAVQPGTSSAAAAKHTPLIFAALMGQVANVRELIGHGAAVDTPDSFGWTALHHGCKMGQVEVVRVLIEAGAQVNATSGSGGTPLIRGAESGNIELVRLLLAHGADPNKRTKGGQAALEVATSWGHAAIRELLGPLTVEPEPPRGKKTASTVAKKASNKVGEKKKKKKKKKKGRRKKV